MKYTTDKMMLRHERHLLRLLDEKLTVSMSLANQH